MTRKPRHKGDLTPFGRKVKMKMLDMDMSLDELAQKVGASYYYLNHIMYGRRPGYKYKAKIVMVLHLDVPVGVEAM